MACGCPAWKSYRDTEEVCNLPVSDGSTYFLIDENEEEAIRTFNEIHSLADCCAGGCSEPEYPPGTLEHENASPGSGWKFDTTLPNPELGEWRYEYTGNFEELTLEELGYPVNDDIALLLSIADCVVTDLIDDGGGVFHWECEVFNPIVYSETESPYPCNGMTFETPRNLWEGVLEIYYTLNEIEYGPITVTADVTRVTNVEAV